MGCADKGQRFSLVIEESPKKKQTSQHSSTVPEGSHPGKQKSTSTKTHPVHRTEDFSANHTNTFQRPPNKHHPKSPLHHHQSLAAPKKKKSQPTHLTTMHDQNPPAAFSKASSPSAAPRRSHRSRKATTRFAEGWYGERLPRLSAALGVAQSDNGRGNTAGGDLSSSDGLQSSGFGMDDEGQGLGVTMVEEEEEEEEEEEVAAVCAPGPRRSGRERKATKRFEEGWFGERLPRLGLALGVNVSGRIGR